MSIRKVRIAVDVLLGALILAYIYSSGVWSGLFRVELHSMKNSPWVVLACIAAGAALVLIAYLVDK